MEFIFENLKSFAGAGLTLTLFFIALVYLMIKLPKGPKKTALVWFSLFSLAIFFCPLWIVYAKFREDAEILYRILWMIPMGAVIVTAMVEFVSSLDSKKETVAVIVMVALIIISGKYVYANRQFKPAENEYHVPQTVVDICDEIIVPGREIRACFPIEMVQYVRQYTALVCQPYGRSTLLYGAYGENYSVIGKLLEAEVYDAKKLSEELRAADTPYFIVSSDKKFTENMSNYDYYYVTNIDGYDIYLDNNAYIGIDFINHR